MRNEQSPTTIDPPPRADAEPADIPSPDRTPAPLVILAGDADALCTDDLCLPADPRR